MSDPPVTEAKSGSDASRISELQKWLAARFGDAGKEVPDFEYTPRSVGYLHTLLNISEAKEKSADIVAKDFRRKAAEYRSQGPSHSFMSLSVVRLLLMCFQFDVFYRIFHILCCENVYDNSVTIVMSNITLA